MKLYNKIAPYLWIGIIILASTFILWLPFLLHQNNWLGLKIDDSSFDYIYRHFDGVLYIIPAKTLYEVNKIDIPGIGFILSLPLSAKYFAAHLPLYPLFIRLFREIGVFGGYLKSMLSVNIFFTLLLGFLFYFIVKNFKLSNKPFILTTIFLLLPRFLVVRSVGAPESLFIFLILLSLYFFEKDSYFFAGLFGALATMTKAPGILLFGAFFLTIVEKAIRYKKWQWSKFWIFLIPLGLLGVFTFYQYRYGDFLAYFHTGGVVPMSYPFSVFNWKIIWVGTAWLEDIIFYLFLYILTVVYLYQSKYRSFFYFSLIFLLGIISVQHRDIARYSLPLWPLACIAFEKLFTSKKFLIAIIIVLPAIFFYAWNFLSYNVMPIADWKPFL